MSTNYLLLIPVSPDYVPSDSARKQAVAMLQTLFPGKGSKVEGHIADSIGLVAPGENFERILCPFCLSELTIEWWHDVMDRAYTTNFTNLDISTPCCHAETSLNDLRYEWPAGFARFTLQVCDPSTLESFKYNPNYNEPPEMREEILLTLQDILGCELRTIWARY